MRAIILASCSLLVAGTTAAAQRYPVTSPQPAIPSEYFSTATTHDLARTLTGNALESHASPLRLRAPVDSVNVREKTCPMPVMVPDSTRSAPMPVAPVNRDKLAPMPVIKPGCTNPLHQ